VANPAVVSSLKTKDGILFSTCSQNEAPMVAIYLGRQLGGHKHEEIGKTVGLEKPSSVSSAYLLMKERVAKEKQLQQRECGRLKKP
jgi:hypothetical protein